MIIQSAQIASGSSRTYRQTKVRQESVTLWNNSTESSSTYYARETESVAEMERHGELAQQTPSGIIENISEENPAESPEESEISASMKQYLNRFQSTQSIKNNLLSEKMRNLDKIRRESINYLLNILFNKDSRVSSAKSSSLPEDNASNSPINLLLSDSSDLQLLDSSQISSSVADGGQYSTFYSYYEEETTHFDSIGIVKTSDGREISFHINLTMSREFSQTASELVEFGTPRLYDPLVINLEGSMPTLTDQKFFFDLDADGTKEEISSLGKGSGYLALDKNNDGTINDGGELFGTTSQNGFVDLAAYDEDGNGWIDEADSIFNKLRIWTKDAQGNDILYTLKDSGVGAIYLGYEDTKFSLKDSMNTTKGVIQKTGLFLYENGNTGTLSQLDLAT